MIRSKYIYFNLIDQKPKTSVWEIRSKSTGIILGIIKWYSPWRQYCFYTIDERVFNKNCLKDVIGFIEEEMKNRLK